MRSEKDSTSETKKKTHVLVFINIKYFLSQKAPTFFLKTGDRLRKNNCNMYSRKKILTVICMYIIKIKKKENNLIKIGQKVIAIYES